MKNLTPHIAIASLSSPLEVGAEKAPMAAESLREQFQQQGCTIECVGSIDTPQKAFDAGRLACEEHVDAVVFTPACWFEDYLVLDFLEECSVPALLWPLPGMETGALCGTQQLTCYLKQLEHPFVCVFGTHNDSTCLKQAMVFLRACSLRKRMRRSRIGLAGHRVAGMTHTAPNEFMLKKIIGSRVVPLDIPHRVEMHAEETVLWDALKSKAACCNVDDTDGHESMRMFQTIKQLVDANGLDALTIGCYPHLMGKVCLAASLLADAGIPMACEGDVNGAVGQLLLTLLTGQATHSTDWLEPLDDGTVILTHCGSGSFSLAHDTKDIKLDHVRLMDQGVCALFPAKTGPVTLISLIAHPDGYQCAVLEGEALPAEMVFPGNPVRVKFKQKTEALMQWIFETGIGHHWMIGYGHVGEDLQAWSKLTDCVVIQPQ